MDNKIFVFKFFEVLNNEKQNKSKSIEILLRNLFNILIYNFLINIRIFFEINFFSKICIFIYYL